MPHTKLGADLEKELHDLCQPLTNLSCFLELGQMKGDADSLRKSVDSAMVECRKMFQGITNMRRRLTELADETADTEALP